LIIYRSPRECCTALLKDWISTDNGVKPKTWRKLIEVLSEMDEMESVVEEIIKGLTSKGISFDGMYALYNVQNKAIGSSEAGETLALPVLKYVGACWPKRLDYEIPFAHSMCLFVCLLGHSPCAMTS